MLFTRNNRKKILILILLVITVLGTSRAHATPLYGGYNGESTTWLEYDVANINNLLFSAKVILGGDVNDHRWAKFRISIVPFIVRLDLTYDSADIFSINFSTLLPWPVLIGSEIDIYEEGNSLWWFTAYLVSGVGGVDSEGTSWQEAGIPGVSGKGRDSNDNEWLWLKLLGLLVGWGEDFTIDGEPFFKQNNSQDFEQELLSLQNYCAQTYGGRSHVLLEKLTEGTLMKDIMHFSEKFYQRGALIPFAQYPMSAPPDDMQAELDSLGTTIAKEVFTEEVRGELQELLNNFAHDVQPRLKKISEAMTTP